MEGDKKMTFEDKSKAKCIIHSVFVRDISDTPMHEIMSMLRELTMLDINREEYDEIIEYLHNLRKCRKILEDQAGVNLKTALMESVK